MGYEIDFLGLKDTKDDADCIAVRWQEGNTYVRGVIDGGFSKHGEAMVDHLKKYYFNDQNEGEDQVIDFVVCTHPDQDHASGLKKILEGFQVRALYMNLPWVHIDALYEKVSDGRKTKETLTKELKKTYCFAAELEELAEEMDIPVYDIFEGDWIEGKIEVLSPSREFYLDMIVEDSRTPLNEDAASLVIKSARMMFETVKKVINWIAEIWEKDNLREDEQTSPINETSTVLLGHMDEENFLLTGDAGIRGLNNAMDYAESLGIDIQDAVSLYQIPHHGGRHNVSTSLLDRMIGDIVKKGTKTGKAAYVMAGNESDHPKKVVTNAYIRRGVDVYEAKGHFIWHHIGDMPKRNWKSATATEFSDQGEDWDE